MAVWTLAVMKHMSHEGLVQSVMTISESLVSRETSNTAVPLLTTQASHNPH